MNSKEMKNTQGGFGLLGAMIIWFCVGVVLGIVGVS